VRPITLISIAVAAAAAAAGAANASDWIVTVGGRAQAVVPYEGAGHDLFIPLPTLQIRGADRPERPAIPDDGVGVAVFSAGALSFGPVGRLRGKRSNEGERTGLREVPLAIEPGLFVTVWPMKWIRLHGEMRKGVRGHSGWIGDAGLDLTVQRGPLTATLGPRIGWGDRHYMDAYFGVTPAEAAASPIIDAAYRPSAGVRYSGLEATLARKWGGRWQTTLNFGFHRLAGIAADSPIVQRLGARNEISGGMGLRYSFDWRS
jgi:outer membrane protein